MPWWVTRPGGQDTNVPDGYNETQGKMSDVAWVSGDGTVVSILKKIAAGGGSAVTIADGADVAEGAVADVVVAAGAAGTVSAKLRRLSADIGSILATGHPITGTVTADTELPPAAALSDTTANPTAPMVGAGAMLWDGAQWVRVPGSLAAGLKIQSAQLPAALAAGGGIKVEGVAGGVAQPVSGTFWQAAQPVTDNAGSLTVDAPVATPVFVRLSDGTSAIATLPVSLATNTPDVTDRAARLLGVVDKGKIWDGTNTAAVKAASALAVATDPAQVVQQTPQRADASVLAVTTISAANTTVTLTLPAPAAGLFHYITSVEIVAVNPTIAAIAAAATLLAFTTTNLPGSPAWNAGTLLAAGAEKVVTRFSPTTPIKSSVAATGTTIVAPAIGTGGQVRITATYYTAP